ncbi:MAG TPA: 50S ribosomal protein L23 [Terriglobia bacterium]|nr:50S ribosomal protein L23 [Terriglobia bacterium]
MNRSPYRILQKPIVTEKSVAAKDANRTLCFKVDSHATKTEIKEAVQLIFKVKVEAVQTSTFAGKERRRGKTVGRRPEWKKAYVKLRSGEKVPEYTDIA